jgi:ferritin-like metal-binding protein YciE
MKINAPSLTEVFKQTLAQQLAAEKKYLKSFQKMSSAIMTHELKSAISADETDIDTHISRLSRAMETVKQKPVTKITVIDEQLLEMAKPLSSKEQSILKDIQILQALQLIFNVKVARYESLYQMAAALDQPEYASLLEQCSKDNQNTFAYLSQIAQNVIYPGQNSAT